MNPTGQPGSQAAKLMYVSMVVGGETNENARVISAIDDLTRIVDEVFPSPQPWHLRVDLIFDVPGPILGNDYEGIRTGRFVPEKGLLVVQAAVPAKLNASETTVYLRKALFETAGLAKTYAKRRKITLSTEPIERAIGALIVRFQTRESKS